MWKGVLDALRLAYTESMSRLVVAVGSNALLRAGQLADARQQFENARHAAEALAALDRAGHQLVVTHGNGPQVGAALLRSELAASDVYRLPYDCCVAATQGEIGYALQHALALALNGRHRAVVSMITQVVVDPEDPAYENPTKPIGPYYEQDDAERLRASLGWTFASQGERGWRRVVASPEPKKILEIQAIRVCLDSGAIVIAAGGGGIPICENRELGDSVEAVIEKDATSALLALAIEADLLVIATDERYVYVEYGKPAQRPLTELRVETARRLLDDGQFPPGSMGAKVEAAVRFVEQSGREAVISHLDGLVDAVAGKTGTRVHP